MTRQRDFKSRVRTRMKRTGERYAAARAQILAAGPEQHRVEELAPHLRRGLPSRHRTHPTLRLHDARLHRARGRSLSVRRLPGGGPRRSWAANALPTQRRRSGGVASCGLDWPRSPAELATTSLATPNLPISGVCSWMDNRWPSRWPRSTPSSGIWSPTAT